MDNHDKTGATVPELAIAGTILGVVFVGAFVLGGDGSAYARPGLPYDDAWIHFVFARNLVKHGTLGLNGGVWSGGTTSPLWDLILAVSYLITPHLALTAKLLGTLLYVALYGLLVALVAPWLRAHRRSPQWTLVFCLTLGTGGALIYMAFTGMDTLLFLGFGLLALVFFEHQIYLGAGLSLAAIVLTRIEGLALVVLMGLTMLYLAIRARDNLWGAIPILVPPTAALVGYLSMNWLITGIPLPTTMTGRKWLVGLDDGFIQFSLTRAHQYIRTWILYIDEWVFVSPSITSPLLGAVYRTIVWGLLILGALSFVVKAIGWLRESRRPGSGLILLFGWFAVHNLTYLLLFPVAIIRHQALNFIWIATILGVGIVMLVGWTMNRSRPAGLLLGLILAASVGFTSTSVMKWRDTWDDHVRHIESVHAQAGRWIDETLPADAVVAAFDIGAIKYFGKRYIVDLGGLSDAEFIRAVRDGRATDYMRVRGVTHLAMPESANWGKDLGLALGVTGPASQAAYGLTQFAAWEISDYNIAVPHSRIPAYLQYPAYPRISIYRVDWE